MKKRICILTAIMLVVFSFICLADSKYPAGDPNDVAVVILHTNDVHVGLENNIGYDGLALYKKELEQQYDHVLLVDAGDAIQGDSLGSISKGLELIKIMNYIGYDLAVLGNHEFDFGLEALDNCADMLACGYTCANFCTSDGEPIFRPWRILEAGNLKIGFVGAVTPDTYAKTTIKDILDDAGEPMYDFMTDTTGDRLSAVLQKYIDEVRENGADYVILVGHLGNGVDCTEMLRSNNIIPRLKGLDMVIDGHSHEIYNRTVTDLEGREIPIAQAGTKMQKIGQLTIYKDGRMEETLVEAVPEPENLPFEKVIRGKMERCVDPFTKAYINEIVSSYAEVMERKIGVLSYDMSITDENGNEISRTEENGLCDLVADAYRSVGKTQIALLHAGSVRNPHKAGVVNYNSILSILPYSNDLFTAELTGQMLLDALEFGMASLPDRKAGFIQVSGITFSVNREIKSSVRIDDKNEFISVEGEYRVSDVMIGDEPLDPEALYTVTMTDYMLNGGDGFRMFKEADVLSTLMITNIEAVIRYIEEDLGGVIPDQYRQAQGRIRWKQTDETENDSLSEAQENLDRAA